MKTLNELTTIFHQTIPLFMTIIYLVIFYYFGIVRGFLGIWLFYKVYDTLVGKIFYLTRVSGGDREFLWNRYSKINTVTILRLEKIKVEEIKNMLIEKGIKKFKKLRSRLTYKFFEWWWQEVDYEETRDRIEVYKKGEFKYDISNKQKLIDYVTEEMKVRFDYEKELPYKFKIIETENDGDFKNLLVLKIDHVLADGMSIVNIVTALADNYDTVILPAAKSISFFQSTMIYLLFPFYSLVITYINIFENKPVQTFFKSKKNISGSPKFAMNDQISLEDCIKVNKKLGITFNDLMISCISAAIKKYSKTTLHGVPPYLLFRFTVSLKPKPKSIEEIEITNNSSGICSKVQMVDNVKAEGIIISHTLKKILRNTHYFMTVKFMFNILFKFFPFYTAMNILNSYYRNTDLSAPNIPGPRKTIYYSGCKVLDIINFASPGFINAIVTTLSYENNFRIIINYDSVIESNPQDLLDFILEELKIILLKTDQ